MAFMCLATWLYLNACCKGEELIPQTWDMFHEKWGFMVIFWNFAGVPFVSPLHVDDICNFVERNFQTYVYSVVYMARHDPSEYKFSAPAYIALYATLLTAHYM